ncbi:MAG: hypothetical protein RBU21_04930 [FCB group bacterium]|jgi:hypothetical protein|nr:hypothetical protein [FCB group bacterium]
MKKGLIEAVSAVFICAAAMVPFQAQALNTLCQGLNPASVFICGAGPSVENWGELTDLNGDGLVNILDFQLAVAGGQGVNPAQTPAQSSFMAQSASPAPRLDLQLLAAPCLPASTVVLPPAGLAQAIRLAHREAAPPEPRTERYLFVLCPNAPPSAPNFPIA